MKRGILLICALLSATSFVKSEIVITSAFSDNMVLQRNERVNVWGEATEGSAVEVQFAGQSVETTANDSGEWSVELEPMKSCAEPRSMEIFESGRLSKSIENILVGEVWMVSGQSNMGLATRWTNGFEELKRSCDYPLIRYYAQSTASIQLSKSEIDIERDSKWLVCNSDNVEHFSSVGCRFGIDLYKGLDENIPIGLIFTAKGGASMTSYIPEDRIGENPFSKSRYESFVKENQNYDYAAKRAEYEEQMREWEEASRRATQEGTPQPKRINEPQRVAYTYGHNTPVYLFNSTISHLKNYTMRGVVWYQGEADSGGEPLENFGELLTLMIDSWRERFQNPQLNFIIIQLPSMTPNENNSWATVRWKQYGVSKALNNCFVSNNIDQGEQDVHPKEKRIVAKRAADVALREVYNQRGVKPYGPRLKRVQYRDREVVINFELDDNSLKSREPIEGFELQIDGRWGEASARVEGARVVVTPQSDGVIGGVRYLWYNWAIPIVSLWGSNDIPAMGFCDLRWEK